MNEIGLKYSQLSVIASPRYAAQSECNTGFRSSKILARSGESSSNLVVTSALQKLFLFKSFLSLFKFVLVRSLLCILTLNFDRIYYTKPIHLTWFMFVIWDICQAISSYFRNCLSRQREVLQRRIGTNMLFFRNF